jgi:methylenetetrahydrofolate reductase (NADPH)
VHWQRLLDQALRVARAGFEPVPHVAVRNFSSREELREFLGGLRETGAVRRVLMIAGDRPAPLGPFASSLHGIQSGLLQEAGLEGVDISGYPEGHARIPLEDLRKALRAKIYAARGAGLDVRVVTQFSFDAKALLSWLLALRYEFPELPIRVGLAGPADAGTLLRYALRCGVRAAARGLGRGLSLLGNLSADRTPLRLVRTLAEGWVLKGRGGVSLHFYAFGGTAKTAAWARALADGALEPETPER